MKRQVRLVLSGFALLTAFAIPRLQAATYLDPTGDGALVGVGGGILDITSVEVNSTATDLIFKINLAGNPTATDWGKYMIGMDTTTGGDPSGNGWVRPIGMNFPNGMDYWIGGWADSGNGAEVRSWSGGPSWNLQSATYGANPDGISFTKDNSSVTIDFKYAGLGLGVGSTFFFDVYTSGGGGTDGAIDALANPSQTVANWGDYYNSGTMVASFTIPEPAALGFMGLGALVLLAWRRR